MYTRIGGEYLAHTGGIRAGLMKAGTCKLSPVVKRGEKKWRESSRVREQYMQRPEVRDGELIRGNQRKFSVAGTLSLMWRLVRMSLRDILISIWDGNYNFPDGNYKVIIRSHNYKIICGITSALFVSPTAMGACKG